MTKCECSVTKDRHSRSCPVSPGAPIRLPKRQKHHVIPIEDRRPYGTKIPKSWKRYGG